MLTVTIAFFYCFVRTDTPRFYIQSGQHEKAKLAISKIYNIGEDNYKLNNIFLAQKAASPTADDGSEKM